MDFLRSKFPKTRVGRAVGLVSVFACLMLVAERGRAEDWMFRRSYYSHVLPAEHVQRFPPPSRRTAYRPALVGTTPGFAIRGVYRYNRIQQGQGRNTDVTIYRENWFELEP